MSNIFLRIYGIQGKSAESEHSNWIPVLYVHWSVARAEGGDACKLSFKELMVIKDADRSSPQLALACARAGRFREAMLDFTRSVNDVSLTIYRIHLSQVMVAGVENWTAPPSGGVEASIIQRETVKLAFDDIRWEYTELNECGKPRDKIAAGWSVRRGMSL